MAKDIFSGRAGSVTGPAERLAPVAPDDGADLPFGLTRSIYVGGAGALSVVDRHGQTVDIVSAAGQYHPIRVARVRATGTTATGVIALY